MKNLIILYQDDSETGMLAIGIIVGIIFLLFVFREVNLWYFRINESIKNQEEQIRLLKKIAGEPAEIPDTTNKEKLETEISANRHEAMIKAGIDPDKK